MQIRNDDLELGSWDDLRYLLAVARSGSFAGAAEVLGVNASTVSRRIELFERLGAGLCLRARRGVELTQAARDILQRVESMELTARTIEQHLVGLDRAADFTVRIAATEGLAAHWLTPRLIGFERDHPGLRIEILTGNRSVDLARGEADLAIRLARPTDDGLVGLHMGRMAFALHCGRAYADLYGMPETLEDLHGHRLVDHQGYGDLGFWQALAGRHRVVFSTNSSVTHVEAVRSGFGISLLPTFVRFTVPDLLALPIPVEEAREIWLVTTVAARGDTRIAAVLAHVRGLFARDRRLWFS